jgi:hypothetical protein
MNAEIARILIAEGEGQRIEFKQSLAEDNDAIKALCAFAHSDGGTVFFGVKDSGEVVGCHVGQNTLERLANKIRTNTQPPLTPAIYKLKLNSNLIIAAVVQKVAPHQVIYAFNVPYMRVGKTNQVIAPEQQRARLSLAIQSETAFSAYAGTLHSTAIGFRKQIVIGRLDYAQLELSRGNSGFRNFLEKIETQRVLCRELMSADETRLTQLQCEMLSRYRAGERELESFISHVSANKAAFKGKPRNSLTGFIHRLKNLADALDRLIESLETE